MGPDQTAPTGAAWSRSTLLLRDLKCFNRRQKHTTFLIYTLMVNTPMVNVYTARILTKSTPACAAKTAYLTLYQIDRTRFPP